MEIPTTAWHVTRIEQDAHGCQVTFERVGWSDTDSTDEDIEMGTAEWFDVTPGLPGAVWVGMGDKFTLPLDRDYARLFDIGRHFSLSLTEVQEAELMEA